MRNLRLSHFWHHWRFYLSVLCGIAVGLLPLPEVRGVRISFADATLFYGRPDDGGTKAGDTGGLEFPKTDEPQMWDFVYFSFVVGMTAQTSNVDVTSRDMRNITFAHGVVSFFFNTVTWRSP